MFAASLAITHIEFNKYQVPTASLSLEQLVKRPELNMEFLRSQIEIPYSVEIQEQVEINLKYEGYIAKAYKEAEKIYLNILNQDKDNAVVLSFLGFLYLTVGLYKKADKCFESSYKIQPSSATVEGLGLTKFGLNDKKNAYKYLSEAVKITQRFDVYDKYIDILVDGRFVEELKNQNIDIDIFKANVCKINEIKRLIDFTVEKYGRIDVLINNAGISEEKLFTDITEEEFDKMIKTNMYSVFFASQEAARYMIKAHSGCIINISSIYGLTGGSCEVAYSMAKAGVDGLTKALAKELGPSNIRVNSIAPGAIDTDMNKDLPKDYIEEETAKIYLERFAQGEEEARNIFGKNGRELVHRLYDEKIIIQLYKEKLVEFLPDEC